jgi:hypothetical protein
MQAGAIQPGQNVVVIDDLIATGEQHVCVSKEVPFSIISLGGSAAAAGELVAKQGGKTIEYLFVIEFMFPRAILDAPVYSIVQAHDDASVDSGRDMDACGAMCCPSAGEKGRVDILEGLTVDDLEASHMIGCRKVVGLGKGECNSLEQL